MQAIKNQVKPNVSLGDGWEIADLYCGNCGRRKRMSIAEGFPYRNTFCISCNKPVLFYRMANDKFTIAKDERPAKQSKAKQSQAKE